MPSHTFAGTELPSYPLAIMMDASTKGCHFATAGRAQLHDPKTSTHLADVARKVLKDFASGVLSSEAKERWEKECAAAAAAGSGGCSSNLTCSRASASARGVVDVSGVAGVFCAHGQPALDGQLAMRTPEQWAYHIRLAVSVLTRRKDIRHLYIDIGCRLAPSLRSALQELVDSGDLDPEMVAAVSAPGQEQVVLSGRPTISRPLAHCIASTTLPNISALPCLGPTCSFPPPPTLTRSSRSWCPGCMPLTTTWTASGSLVACTRCVHAQAVVI